MIFIESAEQLLYREIEKYPVLPAEEQKKLARKYKETGNKVYFEKLVNHNLRLCLTIAKKYHGKLESMTLLDLFQECSITLMKAIELYNPNIESNLSTYAMVSLENDIKRKIDDFDKMIRKPVHREIQSVKYRQFVTQYRQKYQKNPSRQEIEKELGINDIQLKDLEKIMQITSDSLDKKILSDKDSSNLIDFIPTKKNYYQNIELDYDLNILKNKCLKILTKKEYYIIYYRYITEERRTLEQIGQEFNVTDETIRQKEKRALEKLKKRIKYQKEGYSDSKNLDPLPIDTIIILNELKSKLSKEEYLVLYSSVLDSFNTAGSIEDNLDYLQILGIHPEVLLEMKQYLLNIFYQYSKNEEFIKHLRYKYHKKYTVAQLLELDIKINVKELMNFQNLEDYFQSIDIEDIKNTSYYKSLSLQDQKLIQRYYSINERSLKSYEIRQIERELTLDRLGYLDKEKPLYTKDQLQKIYKKCCNLLTDKEREILEKILFNPKTSCIINNNDRQIYIKKLIKIHLKIDDFYQNKITKEQIEKVLIRYPELLTEEEKELVFKVYGIHQEKESLKALADQNNQSYEQLHDKVFNLKERVLFKYYQITENKKDEPKEEDKSLYQSYLKNQQYEFSLTTRRILSMYLSGKTYQEIADIEDISTIKVSNFITEGIRKCEFYKYGIITPLIISTEEMDSVLNLNIYSDFEKQLLKDRYLSLEMPTVLSKRYKVEIKKIHILNLQFYNRYLKWKCPEIPISQYEEEIKKHRVDSILTEDEKKIVSLKYGIKSKYNQDGEVKSNQEIADDFSISIAVCKNRINHLSNKMREKILGLRVPSYGIIERKTIAKILKDPYLPISEKERDIICYTNELNGYPYMSEKELSNKYQEQPSSIKRRYNRAILSIKKYQEGLLPKQINYKKDIKEIEKYFSEYDRKLLEMVYNRKLTEKKIASELGITRFQSRQKIIKIKLDVGEILNDEPTAKMFDFSYARKVLDKENLPLYYMDNALAKKIFKMLTGEQGDRKYSVPELIEKLDLKESPQNISNVLYNVMLAVEKYKRGIRKTTCITYQEIKQYCQKKKIMSDNNKYLSYMERKYLNHPLANAQNISNKNLYELLKQGNKPCIRIDRIDKEIARKNIRNKHLTSNCRTALKNYFQFSEREFMSGKDKLKVLKKLAPLYQKIGLKKALTK